MVVNKSKQQYHNHKARAKRKGIPFELTFEQWYKIWLDSGHYHEKGTKHGQYVMSRYQDKGGYTIDNVYIQTVGDNTREAFLHNNKDFIQPKYGEDNNFYGNLDEIRIFNKSLSENEILSLFDNSFKNGYAYQTDKIGNIFYDLGIAVISDPRPKYKNTLLGKDGTFDYENLKSF